MKTQVIVKENEKKDLMTDTRKHSFNVEELNRIGNNDESFNRMMLDKFASAVSECSSIMMDALANADWKRIKTMAHKSIPSYSIMGLEEIVADLKYIESYADVINENYGIPDLVKLVDSKNKKVLSEIKDYLKHTE